MSREAQFAHKLERMRERHEDIEDLIRFGVSLPEIISRSGYTNWRGIHTSLKNAGRYDLLDKLKLMLKESNLPAQWK